MLKGVPPTKVGKDRDNFTLAVMLVVFVKNLDAMYDSLEDGVDLSKTIFFKVMTILGSFVKAMPDVWIEEARSLPVTNMEKAQILKDLQAQDTGKAQDLLYGYAIEFRGRKSEKAGKAFVSLV